MNRFDTFRGTVLINLGWVFALLVTLNMLRNFLLEDAARPQLGQ